MPFPLPHASSHAPNEPLPFCFDTLTNSLAALENLTRAFSSSSKLFTQNTRGGIPACAAPGPPTTPNLPLNSTRKPFPFNGLRTVSVTTAWGGAVAAFQSLSCLPPHCADSGKTLFSRHSPLPCTKNRFSSGFPSTFNFRRSTSSRNTDHVPRNRFLLATRWVPRVRPYRTWVLPLRCSIYRLSSPALLFTGHGTRLLSPLVTHHSPLLSHRIRFKGTDCVTGSLRTAISHA